MCKPEHFISHIVPPKDYTNAELLELLNEAYLHFDSYREPRDNDILHRMWHATKYNLREVGK